MLDAQAIGNALYGLQGMSSEAKEVRDMLVVLTEKVKLSKELLDAQQIGNAILGLRLHTLGVDLLPYLSQWIDIISTSKMSFKELCCVLQSVELVSFKSTPLLESLTEIGLLEIGRAHV